jgi:hypothetical protein
MKVVITIACHSEAFNGADCGSELTNAFGEWHDEQSHKVLPKSPIGQAVSYAQSNWPALLRYTES